MFQRLPAVRSIFGHRIGSGQFAEYDSRSALPSLDGASSPLEHLELRDSRLPMASLTHLLKAPKALLTFKYEIGRANLSVGGVNSKGIIKALEPQEGSLENLWLDSEHALYRGSQRVTYYEVDFDNRGPDDLIPVPSLSNFQNLKVLRIATVFIFGLHKGSGTGGFTEVLPSTLEILHISHWELHLSDVLSKLEDLLFKKGQHVPKLHHILLQGPTDEFMYFGAKLVSLVSVATAKGVSLIVVNDRKGVPAEEFMERGWGMEESLNWTAGVNTRTESQLSKLTTSRYWEIGDKLGVCSCGTDIGTTVRGSTENPSSLVHATYVVHWQSPHLELRVRSPPYITGLFQSRSSHGDTVETIHS